MPVEPCYDQFWFENKIACLIWNDVLQIALDRDIYHSEFYR